MQFYPCLTKEEMSEKAAQLITDDIIAKQPHNYYLCAATGNSPIETYRKLVERKADFAEKTIGIIKLDEWYGLPANHASSCEFYLQEKLIKPLGIAEENFISFKGNVQDPDEEIKRVQKQLDHIQPMDMCVLGLGANGHLAMNEPAAFLQPDCHLAELAEETTYHSMLHETGKKITHGLTLGMADIFRSKKIVLLINGEKKKVALNTLFEKRISNSIPASFLWLHPEVHCFNDNTVS